MTSSPRCWIPRGLVAVALLLVSAISPLLAAPQLLPGVYGYGADRAINTAGFGSGATIIEVTNLTDGPNPGPAGSLRAALLTTGPRIIVFRTSGVINLISAINVAAGNVTIAGQTAPSPGIAIHSAGLNITSSNILMQHIRIRPGDAWTGGSVTTRDALAFTNSSTVISNAVFDHCTFGWSLDEVASTWYSWDNVTFNKCIFAEPLHVSIHIDEGTFSPNVPQVAQNLTNTKSTSFTTNDSESSTHAVGGTYQLVNTTANSQWIEYTIPIVQSTSTRPYKHFTVVGVKGTDRARFRVELYRPDGTLIVSFGEIFDQYGPEAQHTYISHQNMTQSFTVPANIASIRARLIVDGRHASSTGWKLGIDQFGITDGHGFGPLFNHGGSGGGKLSVTGSIFSSIVARSPWAFSQHFYFGNNVVYNRSQYGLHFGHPDSSVVIRAAVVGNTFIEGPSWSGSNSPISNTNSHTPTGSQLYIPTTDNAHNPGDRVSPPPMVGTNLSAHIVTTDPTVKTHGLSGVTAMAPAAAYAAALYGAGARPADRDAFELRIVDEIADGAGITALASRPGSIKHTVASAGGFPTLAVNTVTHTYPANPHLDDDADGYTNIEEWLHAKALAVEYPIDPPTPQFDNFQDGNANGWAPDGGIWGMTGSYAYQQSDNTASAVRSVLNATSWTDQLVEADVNATSFNGANRFFGVVARYKDAANYYYLVLRSNNTWELKTLVNNTSATLASGPVTVTTGTWYTLSLEVIGTTLKGYLNGVLLGTGTDSTHASGRTALLTYLTAAQFDNVVADPNPGAVNAPLSLSATVAASPNNINTINLAWSNVANETGYKIERKKGPGGSWSQIGTTGTDVVTYGDSTAGAGTQYFYRVRATNGLGDSVPSGEANATTAEVTSGRRAHWKLDENSGTTAADASGNANTGTLSTYGTGNPTWVAGKIGSALDFDAADDVVTAGSGSTLDNLVAQGGGGMTITAWIRPDTTGEGGSPGRIVHKGTGTSPVAGWQFVTQATNTIAFAADHGTTDLNRVAAANSLGTTLGTWKHVVVTWTGTATATDVKLYIDGVEATYGTTTNGGSTRVDDASSSVFLGNDNTGVRTFDGALDDVRIYNRVLTPTELTAIYRAGL